MIRSMTGYGESALHENGVHYFVEVRSLNSKYLKCIIRLPEDLQGLEAEIETELRRRLTRGAVTLTARASDTSGAAAHTINRDALAKYLEQLHDLQRAAGLEARVDAGALLALPGVLQPPADEEERINRARDVLLRLLGQSCAKLITMREREGKALLADLLEQRDAIAARLQRIAERAPRVVEEYERRLRTRINQMLSEATLKMEPADLIREIAIFADKADIAEELARLRGHIEQFTELLSGAEPRPVGRTLDFLAQEMLREANTIASKCGDAEISKDIVEVKGAIDRIKEQVQNAE